MRLLCVATVSLLAATASADPRTVPFDVVNVLPSTQQVLVFDRAHNTHVLLAAGSSFEDYLVVEITGVGMIMEREQERFTVYPRGVQGLALYLEENKNRPPAVYSNVAPVPAQVADLGVAPAPVGGLVATADPRAVVFRSLRAAGLIEPDTRYRGRAGRMSPRLARPKP